MRRWLCAWLALLTALQIAASVLAGLHGSLHRHRPHLQAGAPASSALRWDHARPDPLAPHHAMHQRGEVHAHELHDASVVPLAADAAHDALAQLATAFAPARHGAAPAPAQAARDVQPQARAWAATSRTVAPLLRPPQG
jgi:hypothetical protein